MLGQRDNLAHLPLHRTAASSLYVCMYVCMYSMYVCMYVCMYIICMYVLR